MKRSGPRTVLSACRRLWRGGQRIFPALVAIGRPGFDAGADIERQPDCLDSQVQEATGLIKMQQYQEAERILTQALVHHPNQLALLECLARVAQHDERWAEALERWRSLAERWPNYINASAQIANILARTGQCREAEEVLDAALARSPNHPLLVEALARTAQRDGRWLDALQHWQNLSMARPNQVEAWVQRIKVLTKLQRFAEAERVLHTAAQRWPKHPKLIEALAIAARRDLRWSDALAHWQDLTERYPGHINAWVRRVKVLLELQRPDEAKDVLRIAMERWPNHPKMQEARADALESEQRWPEALKCWKSLSNSHPNFAASHVGHHIAICEIRIGRADDAGRSLEEAIGAREEAAVFQRLFGPHAPFIPYYGRQIEDVFRNLR